MHEQRIRTQPAELPEEAVKQALLGLIVEAPALWSLAELDRHLQLNAESVSGAEPSRHPTEDAVQQLYAAGLLHRVDQFVFASRAAVEAARLGE